MPTYVNVNGVWKEQLSKHTNVNGVWRQATTEYANVNGVWRTSYEDPASTIKLSFVKERHNSTYGFTEIQPTYVTIASGYAGADTCAARSASSFKLNAGDTITINMMHSSVSGSTLISNTNGQTGWIYISDSSTYTLGTTRDIYKQRPPGTMGNYFQKTLTVPASGTYYFHIGVYGTSSYDTHISVNGIWINGYKAF